MCIANLNSVGSGTSGSKIPLQCFQSEADAWSFLNDIKVGNQSEVELGKQWARGKMLADTCLRTQNKTGSLITSAFVARDMMQIVDALQEDGLLRYWGELNTNNPASFDHNQLTPHPRFLIRHHIGCDYCCDVPG